MTSVIFLKLSQLRFDEKTRPRAGLIQNIVDEYAANMIKGDQFPPVKVFYDGKDYWLADGFHRLAAAKLSGMSNIESEVTQGTCRDAVLYSVGANAKHGLRRSNADKRRSVLILLSDPEWSQWSNSQIAKQCGVDEGLIRKLKQDLSSDNPKINPEYARKCGVDETTLRQAQQQIQAQSQSCTVQRLGKIYTLNTTNIGRTNKELATLGVSVHNRTSSMNVLTPSVLTLSPSELALQNFDDLAGTTESIDGLESEHQLLTSAPSRTGRYVNVEYEVASVVESKNLPESVHTCLRILSIKHENLDQSGYKAQVSVAVEGHSEVLIMLLTQIQSNPVFAEEVFQQVQSIQAKLRPN